MSSTETIADMTPGSETISPFVRSNYNFLSVAKKLRERNVSVTFWNASKELKLTLRNVPHVEVEDDDGSIVIELGIMLDDRLNREDDDSDSDEDTPLKELERILDVEYDGWFDDEDDSFFLVDTLRLPHGAQPGDVSVVDAVDVLNETYNTTICPCRRHLLRPVDDGMCLECELTATPEDCAKVQCVVCHESGPKIHANVQKCCKQFIHKACLDNWRKAKQKKNETATCPVCRAELA